MRSGVVATSTPPTWWKQGSPSNSSFPYSSTEYRASRHIVREPFVWNISPGAWDVDPPVANRGP